jgi:hypothetical protein
MSAVTRVELQALVDTGELTVPFLTALAALGIGETAGRRAEKSGRLPFRVIRVGNVLRVPVVDLERLLLTPDSSETGSATDPALALTAESVKGTRDAERATLHAVSHG